MDRPRLVALIALLSFVSVLGQPCGYSSPCEYYQASDGIYYPIPPPVATTEEPEVSTWNQFNEAGWKTDDNGNVYVGDDNAKLYLISVGSFWPFPKDYRRRRSLAKEEEGQSVEEE